MSLNGRGWAFAKAFTEPREFPQTEGSGGPREKEFHIISEAPSAPGVGPYIRPPGGGKLEVETPPSAPLTRGRLPWSFTGDFRVGLYLRG